MAESLTPEAPDEGQLEKTSVPQLLALAWRDQRSGCLRLSHGQRERRILVEQGAPIAVESSRDDDRFAQFLEDTGQIDTGARQKVEDFASKRDCPQASAVLALKLINAKTLYSALRKQTRDQIGETFAWAAGVYRWETTADGTTSPGKPHDVLALIQSQLPERWGTDRLFRELMAASDVFGEIAPSFRRIAQKLASRGDLAAKAVERLDGRVPLGTVLGECAGDPLAAATLWTLLHAGVLRPGECGTESQQPTTLQFEVEVTTHDSERAARDETSDTKPGRGPSRNSEKADSLREEISVLLAQVSELDHYSALGLSPDAGAAQIKKSYFKAAKKYHPDALARLGLDELREDAAHVFARIAGAFETLSNPEKKAAYDKGGKADPEIDVVRLTQAETSFRKGEILVKMGNFEGALEYLEPAVELWPDEPAYQSELGWALYKQPNREAARAREHLETAAEQAPEEAIVQFRLGVVLRALGETKEADELIARAQSIDTSLEE
ncbi:MAG: hypothetical protein CL908_07935 [Deltaproteobacteria bacterium]|nr:hypothetical protein [Deltaproteobacteria bacterium]